MSTLKADTIVAADGSSPVTLTKQSAAKAFVNFDGSGTASITKSLNYSSITDNATGNYTFAFTSNFDDANYIEVSGGSADDGTANNLILLVGAYRGTSPTTSQLRIQTSYISSGAYTDLDAQRPCSTQFGDLA